MRLFPVSAATCRGSWVVWGLCAMVLACDARSGAVVAPDISATNVSAATDAVSLVATVQASGRAEVQGTEAQGIRDESYSFTAIATGAFPLANGQMEARAATFSGSEWMLHAEVTCMSVDGNRAWIGARIIRFTIDGERVPEENLVFSVEDAGEGNNAPDRASLIFFVAPGDDLIYCNTRRDRPPGLRESLNGNIQVRQE